MEKPGDGSEGGAGWMTSAKRPEALDKTLALAGVLGGFLGAGGRLVSGGK